MFALTPRSGTAVMLAGLVWLSLGCASEPVRIPLVEDPLNLAIRFPTESPLALRDSLPIWGSVGNGRATLQVNRQPVRVEPNGAFVAWLPVPAGPTPTLEFTATLDQQTVRRRVVLHRASSAASLFTPPRRAEGWARLRRFPSDTLDLATRAHPITARWFPGGPFAMLLPVGARLPIEARTEDAVGLGIGDGLRVWVLGREVDTLAGSRPDPLPLDSLSVADTGGIVELSVRSPELLVSVVELRGVTLRWSIFGARHASAAVGSLPGNDFVREVSRSVGPGGRADVEVRLSHVPGGWRVRWRGGRLELQIRRPWAGRGLAGLVVALDAGHPPAGSTGPTGLREDSVTLEVARAAARKLQALGARPVLVRPDPRPVSLPARLAAAEAVDAQVLVSIHLDAPAEHQAPWLVDGTLTFYRHPPARTLARALRDSVATAMALKPRGTSRSDLVILRSAWFPAVLIEGTCLVLPAREASFRTSVGIEAYADGIVGGLTRWAAQPPGPGDS